MRAHLLGILVVLGALLAGCVDAEDPIEPNAEAETGDTVYVDDRIEIQTIEKDVIPAPTLETAPNWQLGEWWEIELTDRFVGKSYNSYRVVAGAEREAFLVGMPTHDFSNDLMVLHVPGFGQVMKDDLSFEVHDCPFHPLKFPLEKDETWQTQFECRDVTATVDEVDGHIAKVTLIGNNDHITVTYDAQMRAITEMDLAGYAKYSVVGHGYDFHDTLANLEGLVTVPHMHDVIFQHGRIGGGLGFGGPVAGFGASAPMDTVPVDPTYDRVSFVIILGNLWSLLPPEVQDVTPVGGYYQEIATAPDGSQYTLDMMPTEPAEWKIATFKHDNPDGDWTFEHTAAGPGIAMAEGIAYHVYDVELPSGRILPSVGEHQHGDGGH